MCLDVAPDAIPKIAEEDIVCYKSLVEVMTKSCLAYFRVVERNNMARYLVSPVINMLYRENTEHGPFMMVRHDDSIYEGLHTIVDRQTAIDLTKVEPAVEGQFIPRCFKAIIPKGSAYYEGTFKLKKGYGDEPYAGYVSERLVLQEEVALQ